LDFAVPLEQIAKLLLMAVRISGMFLIAPIFGMRGVPVHFKIGLAFFMGLIALPGVPSVQEWSAIFGSPIWLLLMVVKELAVGLVIGYTATLVFSAIQVAGQFIDLQIGFSIVNVMDPQTGFHMPIIGSFKNLLALLLFLGIDGHYGLITAIMQSFQFVPLGGFTFTEGLLEFFFKSFSVMFLLALKISMPVVAALFLADVGFAIMARTVPQMNIFVVGLPVKLLLGFFMLILTMPFLVYFFQDLFFLMFRQVDALLQLLGGRL
jgi:flagellar biosynthetic protein FliR